MDIEHPAIHEIQSTGYPSRAYVEDERDSDMDYREIEEEEEEE